MAKQDDTDRHISRSAAPPISGNSPTKETTMAALEKEVVHDINEARRDDAPSFGELYEETLDKFRAISAINYLLSNDESDELLGDAARHAWKLARDGAETMQHLWERHLEEFERKPLPVDEPSEWTGAAVETELKALAARIVELPHNAVGHIMDFAMTVNAAHNKYGEADAITFHEIDDMLERGTSVKSINAFWHLKLGGVAAHVPAPPDATEPEHAQ